MFDEVEYVWSLGVSCGILPKDNVDEERRLCMQVICGST